MASFGEVYVDGTNAQATIEVTLPAAVLEQLVNSDFKMERPMLRGIEDVLTNATTAKTYDYGDSKLSFQSNGRFVGRIDRANYMSGERVPPVYEWKAAILTITLARFINEETEELEPKLRIVFNGRALGVSEGSVWRVESVKIKNVLPEIAKDVVNAFYQASRNPASASTTMALSAPRSTGKSAKDVFRESVSRPAANFPPEIASNITDYLTGPRPKTKKGGRKTRRNKRSRRR
jgi:hypothetical protein